MRYTFQTEVTAEANKISEGTVAYNEAKIALTSFEPLLVAMDSMLRYAKAHKKQYGSPLVDDGVLGPEFIQACQGIRGLLNGQGGIALERGMSGDSKDNGMIEGIFWHAVKAGGFKEGKDF